MPYKTGYNPYRKGLSAKNFYRYVPGKGTPYQLRQRYAARTIQRGVRARLMHKNKFYRYQAKRFAAVRARVIPAAPFSGKIVCQTAQTGASATLLNMGILYESNFPWPAYGPEANARSNQNIFCRGLKIHRRFNYRTPAGGTTDVGLIKVHHALVQLKNEENDAEVLEEIQTAFFRDDSQDGRARGFERYTTTSIWDQLKTIGKLNPDNKIRILWHKSKVLQARGGGTDSINSRSCWEINKYIPVKKNFSFGSLVANKPGLHIFELYWYNTCQLENFPTDPAAATYISTTANKQVYFNDID